MAEDFSTSISQVQLKHIGRGWGSLALGRSPSKAVSLHVVHPAEQWLYLVSNNKGSETELELNTRVTTQAMVASRKKSYHFLNICYGLGTLHSVLLYPSLSIVV